MSGQVFMARKSSMSVRPHPIPIPFHRREEKDFNGIQIEKPAAPSEQK